MPAPTVTSLTRHGRLVRLVVLFVAVGVLVPTQSWAQTIPTGVATNPLPPSGLDQFSLGALGFASPGQTLDGSFSLSDSAYGLGDLDPATGAILADDVVDTLSPASAIEHDLLAQQQLLIDTDRLAREARVAYERERAKARSQGLAVGSRSSPGTAQSYDTIPFEACGHPSNTSKRARPETVGAWRALCAAAVADGLSPLIVSGWRDPQHQARLYQEALVKYGSPAAARKWVAFSDGTTCMSRHCGGIAIDVDRGNGMEAWMHTIVGCYTSATSGYQSGVTSCAAGQVPVKRVQLYGFILPMAHEPWHIELGIPVEGYNDGGIGASCNPDRSATVPQMIGAIWRCRLGEAGISGGEADRIVAEAVVVAKCESGWNTSAVAFGGKYVSTPHPKTGSRYSAAGVFQFIRGTANSWIPGGYANVHDPVANIDAASRLFLNGYQTGGSQGGWRPWECAVGALSGGSFRAQGVLPQFGGDALPDWAYQY